MPDSEFDLSAFLAGRTRTGTLTVPGAGSIEVKELGAMERLKILADNEAAHKVLMAEEGELILVYDRVKAGTATPEDSFKIARFNQVAAPYYAALISAITVKPHLSPEEVHALFNALDPEELSAFIEAASGYFTPPDVQELKKKPIGGI